MNSKILHKDFLTEIEIRATRSSGPGGQHVNKVSTRVELRFDILNSALLNEEEKSRLIKYSGKRVSKEGILVIVSQASRSQLKNKEEAILKFHGIIEKAFRPVKRRIATSPSPGSAMRRLEEKRMNSERKGRRMEKRGKSDIDYS